MEIGAAKAKGRHPRPPLGARAAHPGARGLGQIDRHIGSCEDRIGIRDQRMGWQHLVMQPQRDLDQSGQPRRGLGVADQRLDRADGGQAGLGARGAQRGNHGLQFGLVAGHGAGAMGFEQFHRRGRKAGLGIGAVQRALLACGQGGCQPLGAAIRRGADALDHAINPVAVALGIGQPLQDHGRQPFGDDDAVGLGVKGVADPARAQRLGLGKAQITEGRLQTVHPARDHGIGAPAFQLHHRGINGGERGGAGGIDHGVGAPQIKAVGDPAGRHIGQDAGETVLGPFGQLGQERLGDRAQQPGQFRTRHILRALLAHPPRKPEDHRGAGTVQSLQRAAGGILQGILDQFQRQKLHRIDRVQRAGRDAVIQRIEGHIGQKAAALRIDLVARLAVRVEIAHQRPAVLGHRPDGTLPRDDPPPIARQRVRPRQQRGHADDGDIGGFGRRRALKGLRPRLFGPPLKQRHRACRDILVKLCDRADALVQRRDLPDHVHAFALALFGANLGQNLVRPGPRKPLGRHAQPSE